MLNPSKNFRHIADTNIEQPRILRLITWKNCNRVCAKTSSMKRVIIIPKKKAESVIPKITETDFLYYYLTDDYSYYINLRDKFADKIEIRNLSGLLDITVKEVKGPLIELISGLNKKHDSLEWWGGQIASKSTTSTPVFLNIIYLFCIKKILAGSNANFVFIVNRLALSMCIESVAAESGFQVFRYKNKLLE